MNGLNTALRAAVLGNTQKSGASDSPQANTVRMRAQPHTPSLLRYSAERARNGSNGERQHDQSLQLQLLRMGT